MIKVHIISGFLGAGKTTFLSKLVDSTAGKKVIIENEFGEVGIDGEIMQRNNYDVVEMAQGCICCSMKTDFEAVILSVIEDYHPQHIFIEPTGIGMLSQIIALFKSNEIADKCSLTLPIVVVDVLDYMCMVDDFGLFYKDQIIHAEIIVLSKIQLMEEDNLDEIVESIRKLNKRAEILAIDWEQLTELDILELTNRVYDADKAETALSIEISDITGNLQSFSLNSPKRLSIDDLRFVLDRFSDKTLGEIIRAKGFVEGDEGPLEFSYVNGRYSIDENRLHNSNRISIIGINLNQELLNTLLIK